MLPNSVLMVIGFALLIKGTDFFVITISKIAKKLGISEFLIGLTIVAFATSVPEFANSIVASYRGYGEIIIGNIVGSNIINMTLILGISALVSTLTINKEVLKRDGYLMIVVAVLFFLFSADGVINLFEGIILLNIYLAYILFLINSKKAFVHYHFEDFVNYFVSFKYYATLKKIFTYKSHNPGQNHSQIDKFLFVDLIIMSLSFVAIAIGANLVVSQAVRIASILNVSKNVIALSVIALGTTLPEMTVSLVAAKKGFGHMAVGNLIGSNICNSLLIIGTASLIRPITVIPGAVKYTLPFMVITSVIAFFFIKNDEKVSKKEGVILISLFAGFTILSYLLRLW